MLVDFNVIVSRDHITWEGVIGKEDIENCDDNGTHFY